MDIAEIEKLLSLLGTLGLGAIIGGFGIYLIIKNFLPSYLSEKGKNLATKEDIASITDKIESVKTDYAKTLEELKTNNQLKLSDIERERSIKREVYLQAIESFTRLLSNLANLTNLNFKEEQLSSIIANDSGVIAKIQIVGSEDTVNAVSTIMTLISTAILELRLERSPLIIRKNEIELYEKYRSETFDEIKRYLSIMKNKNIEGNPDQSQWAAINKNIDFEKQQQEKFSNKIEDLQNIQNNELLTYMQKCMERHFEIAQSMPNAILSIRNELNLPISKEAYLNIFNKNIEQSKRVISNFFNEIVSKHIS